MIIPRVYANPKGIAPGEVLHGHVDGMPQRGIGLQPKVGAPAPTLGHRESNHQPQRGCGGGELLAPDVWFQYAVVMALSDAYLVSTKNLPEILKAIRQAQPPERFSNKFLEGLDFKSTNDRSIIGVLKALGFLDESGTPKQPYFDYMDDERHKTVLAEGIRRAYADLFKLNKDANEKDAAWVKNKLKTLTQGAKSDTVLAKMTPTFLALCKEADFSGSTASTSKEAKAETPSEPLPPTPPIPEQPEGRGKQHRFGLAYNIHIELPAVRDQAVYDAIFKSLRENLL